MNKKFYIIAGALTAVMTTFAVAQERGMSEMDTNKNGTVEKSEFEASLAARFAETDKNGDGITIEEYQAKRDADMAARAERRAERKAEKESSRAEKTDERAARNAERTKKRFESMDANSDGKISSDEYKASGEKMFERMDRDGDGILNDRRGRDRKNKS